jgi:CHAT domain
MTLRQNSILSKAKNPFLGIGDPLLSDEKNGIAKFDEVFVRRGSGDVRKIRLLPNLPETGVELRLLASKLSAGPENVYVGKEATEGRVRSLRLNSYKVIAFATHGLVAGELNGVNEPV